MNPSDVVASSAALAVFAHRHPGLSFPQLMEGTKQFVASSDVAATCLAGMTAGSLSRTLTAPLDRIKTLAQEGRVGGAVQHRSEVSRMAFIARHVASKEGVRCFWRGNGANCLKAGPEYAVAFTARQEIARFLCRDPKAPSALENFALGAASGLTAQSLLYPLEVTKTRMAVAQRGEYAGILDCITQSLARGGVRDLYRGLCANLVGVVPHRSIEMGLFFSGEQALRTMYGPDGTPIALVTAVGFGASIVSQVVTYPLNLARTRLQTQGVNGRPIRYTSLAHCLTDVVRTDGVKGLFAGIAPNMLKAAPASAIMYTTFSRTKSWLQSA